MGDATWIEALAWAGTLTFAAAGAVWIAASVTSMAPSGTVSVGALVTLAVRFGSRALGLSLPVPREPT